MLAIDRTAYPKAVALLNMKVLDIFLMPFLHTYLEKYQNNKENISQSVDELFGEHIYSYYKPKQWPVFTYFRSFEINIWLSILS